MKRKFSLNSMLHNKKAMLIFSLLAAIVVWASVAYGPSGEITRTITDVPISVVLPTYAQNENLRIVGETSFTSNVTVSGPRSRVGGLSRDDIQLTADTSQVVAPNTYQLNVTVQVAQDNVVVEGYTNQRVEIKVDQWVTRTFQVEADVSAVKVADEQRYRLGTPLLESDGFVDGSVVLEGPSSQMSRIERIVAQVEDPGEPISEVTVFSATLKAVDADGAEVDISDCTYIDNTDGTMAINVTVPVEVYQSVTFAAQMENMPEVYENRNNFVTFEPASIEFWGSPSAVEAFMEQLNDIGQFDFDNLQPTDTTRTVTLQPPDGITIIGDVEEVTATLALGSVTSRTMSLTLTDSNVTFLNVPDNRSVSCQQSQLTGIVLCGPSSTLRNIRESDLRVTIDMSNNATTGTGRFEARVTVNNRTNVWTYYGEDGKNGIDIWVTVDVE